jgi:hypothetical protein
MRKELIYCDGCGREIEPQEAGSITLNNIALELGLGKGTYSFVRALRMDVCCQECFVIALYKRIEQELSTDAVAIKNKKRHIAQYTQLEGTHE